MNMTTKRLAIFSMLCSALLAGGCASMRVITDVVPSSDPALKSEAGKFRIESIAVQMHGLLDQGGLGVDPSKLREQAEGHLLSAVRAVSVQRYPGLFGDTAGTIPLAIHILGDYKQHIALSVVVMICTVDVCGAILPTWPDTGDLDCEVELDVNAADQAPALLARTRCHRTQRSWVSLFTPLGLIPVPGKSDLPRYTYTIFDKMSVTSSEWMHQMPEQIVEVVARTLARTDPGVIRSMPGAGGTGPLPATILPSQPGKGGSSKPLPEPGI